MGRAILRGTVVALTLLLVVLAAGLLYRAWRQHGIAQQLAIKSPPGIDEASFVKIGGIDQFITIRGGDRANPAILFVHGGPGNSMVPFAPLYRPWEKYFTVVQWDQRGAGKTWGRNGRNEAPLTVERMVDDGIEVAEYLRTHLHKDGVIVLAHSWGTVLGVQMVKRRPDLFAAYVGTGQVVAKEQKEEIVYARMMKTLIAAHDDKGIVELKSVGPPPYKSEHDLRIEREISGRYDVESERTVRDKMTPVVLFAPDFSLRDIYDFLDAPGYVGEVIYPQQLSFDARKLGPKFEVPFFIIEGEADTITPPDLAKAFLDSIEAPEKEFILLKGDAGHVALLTKPDVFLKELLRLTGRGRATGAPPPR